MGHVSDESRFVAMTPEGFLQPRVSTGANARLFLRCFPRVLLGICSYVATTSFLYSVCLLSS